MHCFFLDESGFVLNEVFVTNNDIEKLFKKSIKDEPVLAGGIAEAYYRQIPFSWTEKAMKILQQEMKQVISDFYAKFHIG